MNLHRSRAFTGWVIDVLKAGGLTVGYAQAPPSFPAGAGYVVVYPIAGGTTDGTLNDPLDDAMPNVQVTASSFKPEQTQWLVDKVRGLLAVAVPASLPDGRRVVKVDFPFADVTVGRDDDVQPPRFWAPDRMEFWTTPA